VKTKLIKLMGILAIILLFSSPVLASGNLYSANQSMGAISAQAATATYTNPLPVQIPDDGLVESCADPSIIYSQTPGDNYWYMYCTTDPLNDDDKTGDNFNFRLIPMLRSTDLVNWEYMGDAFTVRPDWLDPTSGLWAPEIDFFDGLYYLYYTVPDVADSVSGEPGCHGDSAIGVATSESPLGPWEDQGPVVEPRRNGPGCNFFWTFDPEVVEDNGQKYIFFGSYYGGIAARELSADGLQSDPGSQVQITIPNRYEGAEVVYRDGYWYLFVSATNCCNGPLTAYSVFVGRSENILGPYVDREGVSLLAGRVGGTPILSMNGNRWVGTGHNSVFQDFDGQWWTVYHAVDRDDPYFEVRSALQNDRCCWMRSIGSMAGQPYEAVSGRRIIPSTRLPRSPVRRPTIIFRPRNPMNWASSLSPSLTNSTASWAVNGVGCVNQKRAPILFPKKHLASIHSQWICLWIATTPLFFSSLHRMATML